MSTHITKEMMIGDVIKTNPDTVEIMQEHGMHCIGCHIASWETIEQGAMAHGIDVKKLVNALNRGE